MKRLERSLCAAAALFVVLVLLSSCASGTPSARQPGPRSPTFFPPGLLGTEGNSDFVTRWYSSHLIAMDEPSLWEASMAEEAEIYRFLWLPTFDHPVVVRVVLSGDRGSEIVVKLLSGQGGYEPGHLIRADGHPLSPKEQAGVAELIETSGFWSLPVQAEAGLIGVDGEQWIVEGVRPDDYHVADRWSPENGPVRQIGEHLLRLAGLAHLLSGETP